MADGPYSRVYWSIVDDPEFSDVFGDDAALACWLRLLLIADQAWPSSAHLPRSARTRPLDRLMKAGLVIIASGGRFHIRGMDEERGKRQQSARNAAALRWHSDGSAEPMPRREEHRRDEVSKDEKRREGTPSNGRYLPLGSKAPKVVVDP